MTFEQRKAAFNILGDFLTVFTSENKTQDIPFFKDFQVQLEAQITLAQQHNAWFSNDHVMFALKQWGLALSQSNLDQWLDQYPQLTNTPDSNKTVAVIMAGNIPLVGFHDALSVLLCGHKLIAKHSSNDQLLLPLLIKYLETIEPKFKGKTQFTNEKLSHFDAVIATGSNNTARYFEHYFGKYPNIIRKNRNSVAVLTGNETAQELEALSEDIFRYYGLGCRNVSKLFVPKGYNFEAFFKAIFSWQDIINHAKYANNYDYNKAVYLMSEFKLLENGFLMLKKDTSYASPIATLFYEEYNSKEELLKHIKADKEQIQCVLSKGFINDEIIFGQSQYPNLWDYADGEDTISFLTKI